MIKTYILPFGILMCCIFQSATAQQIDGRQGSQRGFEPTQNIDSDTYIGLKDPYEETNIILPKCIEEFKLDAFEKEIFKGLLIKKFEKQNIMLNDKKISFEEQKKNLQDLNNNFYKELSSILTVEEIEKYKVMDFKESKEEKKKKKKDKRKNRKT